MKLNTNYRNLQTSYLFSTIAKKVHAFSAAHPQADIIRLGIGDVTLPLCTAVTQAMHGAVDEMGKKETFRGYGPEQGYAFLQTAIAQYYARRGVTLELDEIFISDGAKSDLGNMLDLFDKDNAVLIPNPVYPVYVDTNVMDGRKIVYVDATEENGFLPLPPQNVHADLIYMCSPNNPTGAVYTRDQLKQWVDYANEHHAVILFDAAYEAFIGSDDLPHSIYEIDGARTCAVEVCSLSKTGGFTGTRCGYTIVPKQISADGLSLNAMWLRRQTTKFNGVNYIVQRGAEAIFTPEGQAQTQSAIAYYKNNAAQIARVLDDLGIWYCGGKHSPYIWLKCGMDSWAFFDMLLEKANVVGTPGAGFGRNGEGFFRLTGFGDAQRTVEAAQRLKEIF